MCDLSTSQKGHLALLKVEMKSATEGCVLSRPSIEGCVYDCVIDKDGQLHRCQIKYVDGDGGKKSTGKVCVGLSSWTRSGKVMRKGYHTKDIDAFLLYIPRIEQILWIPSEILAGKTMASIRIEKSKNNQTKNCIMASDYIW